MLKGDYLLDYYRILGIEKSASLIEIKRAYRKMARLYHPDLNPGKNTQRHFIRIQTAYDALCDLITRSSYERGFENAGSEAHRSAESGSRQGFRSGPPPGNKTASGKKEESLKKAEESVLRLLIFSLGESEYALNIEEVSGLAGKAAIKALDNPNSAIVGRLNTRGEDWLIVDPERCLGLKSLAGEQQAKVILAELEGVKIGFIVNNVSLVTDLKKESMQDLPPGPAENPLQPAKVITKEGRMIFILRLEQMLPIGLMATLKELA